MRFSSLHKWRIHFRVLKSSANCQDYNHDNTNTFRLVYFHLTYNFNPERREEMLLHSSQREREDWHSDTRLLSCSCCFVALYWMYGLISTENAVITVITFVWKWLPRDALGNGHCFTLPHIRTLAMISFVSTWPTRNALGSGYCFSFWYHMYGQHVDALKVIAKTKEEEKLFWTRKHQQVWLSTFFSFTSIRHWADAGIRC